MKYQGFWGSEAGRKRERIENGGLRGSGAGRTGKSRERIQDRGFRPSEARIGLHGQREEKSGTSELIPEFKPQWSEAT